MCEMLLTAMTIDEVQLNATGHDDSFDDGPIKFSNTVLRSSRAIRMSKMKFIIQTRPLDLIVQILIQPKL